MPAKPSCGPAGGGAAGARRAISTGLPAEERAPAPGPAPPGRPAATAPPRRRAPGPRPAARASARRETPRPSPNGHSPPRVSPSTTTSDSAFFTAGVLVAVVHDDRPERRPSPRPRAPAARSRATHTGASFASISASSPTSAAVCAAGSTRSRPLQPPAVAARQDVRRAARRGEPAHQRADHRRLAAAAQVRLPTQITGTPGSNGRAPAIRRAVTPGPDPGDRPQQRPGQRRRRAARARTTSGAWPASCGRQQRSRSAPSAASS